MQTSFSQRGIQERGDTRGWTETPQQKLLRLSAAEQARPQALEAAVQPQSSAAAEAVDAYYSSHRAKTLVEKHQEKLKVCKPLHPAPRIKMLRWPCARGGLEGTGQALVASCSVL